MANYPDLHEHLQSLEKAGLLLRIDRPINKDTEMHPLVRWQFRGGIKERDRKAFLFTNVTDSKGRRYEIPVVVGALAASREIYRIGMGAAKARHTLQPLPPTEFYKASENMFRTIKALEAILKPAR